MYTFCVVSLNDASVLSAVCRVSGAQLIPLHLHFLAFSVSAIHFMQKPSRIMTFSAFPLMTFDMKHEPVPPDLHIQQISNTVYACNGYSPCIALYSS